MFDLKSRREELKISQDDIAKAIGVSRGTVSKWESGNIANMKRDKIAKLANLLHISPLKVLGINDSNTVEHGYDTYSDIKRIPIIGEIACGDPITAEQNIDGYRSEPADRLPSGDVFFLRCKGNSMEPTISDGSYVLIKGQPEVEDGEIAAVLVDDQTEATLKRVHHQGRNIVLTGDNASFPPIILNEQYPGRIIGKAIRVSFDL